MSTSKNQENKALFNSHSSLKGQPLMEQKDMKQPHLSPENNLRHLAPPYLRPQTTPFPYTPSTTGDDQQLPLAFSTLNLSFPTNHHLPPYNSSPAPPPPPFMLGGGLLVGSYWCPPSQVGVNNNSNVNLMSAQNGGVSFAGHPSGALGGFLVGPFLGGNILGGGVAGPPFGILPSLDFYDVGQRGNVCGQHGYDHTSRIENVNYPTFSQNINFHEGQINNFVPTNLSGNYRVKDLKGLVVSLAKDQSWSKILLKKIEEKNVEDIEFVVVEVVDYVCDLMKNQFGGYFIQKLFGMCNEDQRTRIIVAATRMSFELVNVCLSSHGAQTVQTLLENLNTPEQISLVISALSTSVVVLSNDPHGQLVMRSCLTNFSYEFNKLLLDKILQNCIKIAINKCGCCVLQSCVEYSHGEHRERLIDEVIANASRLAQDPFGNYVVQHLVGLRVPEITADLIQHLRGKFVTLSCNKFASNVVEKFLLEAGEEYATTIIEDLLENSEAASMLLINPYGNFVIQTALKVSQGQVFEKLLDLILENGPSIRNNTYGEKIFAWFEKKDISLGKFMKK